MVDSPFPCTVCVDRTPIEVACATRVETEAACLSKSLTEVSCLTSRTCDDIPGGGGGGNGGGGQVPEPPDSPCYGNPPYIVHNGSIHIVTFTLDPYTPPPATISLNEMGIYYDDAHSSLVPGCQVTLPNQFDNGDPDFFWWIKLPDAALNVLTWAFRHYIQIDSETGLPVEHWENMSGDGVNWTSRYATQWPQYTLENVYWTGLIKQLDPRDDFFVGTGPAQNVALSEDRFICNPYFTDPRWAALGYSISSMGVYYGAKGTFGVPPYTLVPGSIVSGPSFAEVLSSYDMPVPANSTNPERYWLYLGISFNDVTGVFYHPYARVTEPHPMQYMRFEGTIGGSDTFKTVVWCINEVDQFPICLAPTVTFSASPTSLPISGGVATLSWTIIDGITATIDNGVGSVSIVDGSTVVSVTENTTYTLTVVGLGGTTVKTVTITLPSPVIESFTATPTSITSGDSSTLSWVTSLATGASINQGVGSVSTISSTSVSPTTSTIYTLTATGPGGSVQDDVTVTVEGSSFAPAWAYWKMEEASGDRADSSGNGRTLHQSGGTLSNTTGKIGNAVALSGTGKTLALTTGTLPDFSGDAHFMFAFWTNRGAVTGALDFNINAILFLNYNAGTGKNYIEAFTDALTISGPKTIDPATDHFIVLYYNGTGLYVEVDNAAYANALGSSGFTGAYSDGYMGESASGWIDEFGMWTGANADTAIANRADLWNGGAGFSPY